MIDKCYENRVFFLVINDGKFIKFYEFFEKLIVICVDEKEERGKNSSKYNRWDLCF